MSRYRLQIAAISLAAFAVAEVVLSIAAIGHRHSHDGGAPLATNRCIHDCSHGHDHEVPSAAQDGSLPVDASGTPQPSHDDCSICRHLAQVAVFASYHFEPVSEEISQH